MNWTIVAIIVTIIAIVAIKALWNEINKNWGDFPVKHDQRTKNDEADITPYAMLAVGKSHTAKLAEGKE